MHIFSDLMMCKRMFMTFNYPVAVTVFFFLSADKLRFYEGFHDIHVTHICIGDICFVFL